MPQTKKKNGLQKLTESQQKIDALFKLPKVTEKNIEHLTEGECQELSERITKAFNKCSPEEKSKLLHQFEDVVSPVTKYEIWETNHNSITAAISNLMQEKRRMPSVKEIAERAELSRQTVYKHLKEYKSSPVYLDQVQKYEFMTNKVLTNLFIFAINGDVAAAKVYLSAMSTLNLNYSISTFVQTQNNFIQICGTRLSQEEIDRLSDDQISILKTAIPKLNDVILNKNNQNSVRRNCNLLL